MPPRLALACPASLKGVLSAREAAAALAEGLRAGAFDVDELPVADGGEGTADVLGWDRVESFEVIDAFGRPREAPVYYRADRTAIVESATVIPLDPERLDPLRASSRGLGDLITRVEAERLLVCLGGTAVVDGGAGMRAVVRELPAPTTVLCVVRAPLVVAARVFARQKGASDEELRVLEDRLLATEELRPFADVTGAGSAGGLGAAFAALGAKLVAGADFVLEAIGFEPRGYDLVVTGEGVVDATTALGKAPAAVARACAEAGVRCAVFGGRVSAPLPGTQTYELSGNPARAGDDLRELGRMLATR